MSEFFISSRKKRERRRKEMQLQISRSKFQPQILRFWRGSLEPTGGDAYHAVRAILFWLFRRHRHRRDDVDDIASHKRAGACGQWGPLLSPS